MRSLVFFLYFATATFAADPTPTVTLDLWPAKAPGETKELPPEAYQPTKPNQLDVKRLGNVSKPQIAVYAPEKPNGTAVVIAPGGGYSILAIEHEGTDVATWLNKLGVTAIVLKYRVPRRAMQSPDNLAQLQDAQRALGLVRSKAAEWKLDPKRIGMLGFSAGGHLTATLCTNFSKRLYDAVDDADKASCRPDFAVLVYPAYLAKKDTADIAETLKVTKETPPMFFAHASDDPVSSENSVAFYRELKKNGVSAELHLYSKGGHGFGMRTDRGPVSAWPKRCEEWLTGRGLVK
ncbi:MAG: alpha/beta hydrolase [Gemmataceae bacterium]|nr:alpha/beta hydrolase [Gemmataceae bacterium]